MNNYPRELIYILYVYNVSLRFLFLQDYQHKSQSLWKVTVRRESILYQTQILTRNGNQAQKKIIEILVSGSHYTLYFVMYQAIESALSTTECFLTRLQNRDEYFFINLRFPPPINWPPTCMYLGPGSLIIGRPDFRPLFFPPDFTVLPLSFLIHSIFNTSDFADFRFFLLSS